MGSATVTTADKVDFGGKALTFVAAATATGVTEGTVLTLAAGANSINGLELTGVEAGAEVTVSDTGNSNYLTADLTKGGLTYDSAVFTKGSGSVKFGTYSYKATADATENTVETNVWIEPSTAISEPLWK